MAAADDMLNLTDTKQAPWHLIQGDSKDFARYHVLKTVTRKLAHHANWIEDIAQKKNHRQLKRALVELKKMSAHLGE